MLTCMKLREQSEIPGFVSMAFVALFPRSPAAGNAVPLPNLSARSRPHGRFGVARIRACAPPKHDGATGWKELEQAWRFQQRKDGYSSGDADSDPPPKECEECHATGLVTCHFCLGTAFLHVGSRLMCSVQGGSTCPVCHATGEVACRRCGGSGHYAAWLIMDSD
jgi:hypothetical protein